MTKLVVLTAEELRVLVSAAIDDAVAKIEPAARSPALLDRAHLAKALDASISTVDRLVRQGCPFVWLLDSRRFEIEAVKAWLRTRAPLDRTPDRRALRANDRENVTDPRAVRERRKPQKNR